MVRRAWRGEVGLLRLGFTATAAFVDLPLILNRAAIALPDVRILLKEGVSASQTDSLLADMIDVAVLRPPIDRTKFGVLSVRKEHFVAALHDSDARAKKSTLTLQDFDGQNFIMYSADGAGYSYRMLTAMFDQACVSPIMIHHLDQNHSILALVSAGMGAALVPDTLAAIQFPNVVFRNVDVGLARPLELFMSWRPDNHNPALAPFLALARTMFSAPDAPEN
jgi:DNA-binding transcriptional LysR family regulator